MTQNNPASAQRQQQHIAADSLHQAAEALRREDDQTAVDHIERAKQLLEESESIRLDLAATSAD
ncbi:hypothetical protein [Phormidium sp. FACHB-1136]|uniref:hypothetical protein n=1 Tax=Phormidium sp. FACHB-1136 TaxID=2692848 RepID=UPI001682C9B1|nr:hypothetical protein [Phormidium sp. FACHB-1136]MBD2425380.1 hypothetical protein [Phormidium sp. FACHB-1136]